MDRHEHPIECLAALTGLAEDVEKSGKRLIVVSMPLLGLVRKV